LRALDLNPKLLAGYQIAWGEGAWRVEEEDGRGRGVSDYLTPWADRVLNVLKGIKDLSFSGRTITVKP
jgi:hypothetical protein